MFRPPTPETASADPTAARRSPRQSDNRSKSGCHPPQGRSRRHIQIRQAPLLPVYRSCQAAWTHPVWGCLSTDSARFSQPARGSRSRSAPSDAPDQNKERCPDCLLRIMRETPRPAQRPDTQTKSQRPRLNAPTTRSAPLCLSADKLPDYPCHNRARLSRRPHGAFSAHRPGFPCSHQQYSNGCPRCTPHPPRC